MSSTCFQTWVAGLASHPLVPDAVEDLPGPDLLVRGTSLFVEEVHSSTDVSWHRDPAYRGLSDPDVATSSAPPASGRPPEGADPPALAGFAPARTDTYRARSGPRLALVEHGRRSRPARDDGDGTLVYAQGGVPAGRDVAGGAEA